MKVSKALTQPLPVLDSPVALDVAAKVAILWAAHPQLTMPYTYGQELVEYDGWRVKLPDDAQDVYQWSWRKVQQYCVQLLNRDPGTNDSIVIRANVAGECRGRRIQRIEEDRKYDAEHERLTRKWEGKSPAASSVKIIKVKPQLPVKSTGKRVLIVRKK
jgi:hypothetical protein